MTSNPLLCPIPATLYKDSPCLKPFSSFSDLVEHILTHSHYSAATQLAYYANERNKK
jgi:hypothetical protein